MHHFLTAAGILAVIGFAFGHRAAIAVAQFAIVTAVLLFALLVTAVMFGYFE
jgi:hypothetical protein